jgi:protein arginine N-methyltransferase 2
MDLLIREEYIKSNLKFTDDGRLMDGDLCVMMDWETPIMKHSAEIICKNGGKILNIGFGLGIIDSFIQKYNIEEHYIIECHPDVLLKMKDDGWYDLDNVKILEGFWQDFIDDLGEFDGVYFDTWKESDFYVFLEKSKHIVKKGGIMTFFNSGPIAPERNHIPNCMNEILEKNFTIKSEIIKFDFKNRNIDGMEYYWEKHRNESPITICTRK